MTQYPYNHSRNPIYLGDLLIVLGAAITLSSLSTFGSPLIFFVVVNNIVVQQLDNGYQVARITVNGKTGTRHVRLNNSYPRLKEWLSVGHPYPANPNSPLFCGIGKRNTGKKLASHTMHSVYDNYKRDRFPLLLQKIHWLQKRINTRLESCSRSLGIPISEDILPQLKFLKPWRIPF